MGWSPLADIHNVGLYVLQAPGIMHAVACQNHIDSNILFRGPRAGFNFNDHFGEQCRLEMLLLCMLIATGACQGR